MSDAALRRRGEHERLTVRDKPTELRHEARRGDTLLGQIRCRPEPGLCGVWPFDDD
jgi:hypothetical protein